MHGFRDLLRKVRGGGHGGRGGAARTQGSKSEDADRDGECRELPTAPPPWFWSIRRRLRRGRAGERALHDGEIRLEAGRWREIHARRIECACCLEQRAQNLGVFRTGREHAIN